MLTLTDPIWVSVRTTAGIKTPSNYTDGSGAQHVFTIDDSEHSFASSSQLQNPWNLPVGIDDSGRVQPRLDLLTPFYRVGQGTIGLGVDASVGVTQTWEPYGAGHRLTVTPSIPLDGREWQIDTAAMSGVFVVEKQGIEYRVGVTTTVVGEQVVIDVVATGDGINPVPTVDPTAPFLTMYAGGLAMHEAFWRTPAYVETITPASDEAVLGDLTFRVEVENNHGGTLAPEDIDITWSGTTDEGAAVDQVSPATLATSVAAGTYAVSTPAVDGYTYSDWTCGGIGWFGSYDEVTGEFTYEDVSGVTQGAGLECVRVYTDLASPVEPPVVVPPVEEPPAATPPVEVPVTPEVPAVEDPAVVEEPVEEPVFNQPFRPETDVVTTPAGQHGIAFGFAAAALLAGTGSALLLRARRVQD